MEDDDLGTDESSDDEEGETEGGGRGLEEELAFADERESMKHLMAKQQNIMKGQQKKVAAMGVENGRLRNTLPTVVEKVRETIGKLRRRWRRGTPGTSD